MEEKLLINLTENVFVEIYPKAENMPTSAILPNQLHNDNIVEIITGKENIYDCDGLITGNKSFVLGIKTADCAPICFSDGEMIGIAHVGWRGLCLSLVEKMTAKFKVKKLHIFVGPFIHSFEIKKDFCFDKLQEKFGNKFFKSSNGKIMFLFKDALMSLLPKKTEFDPRDTFKDLSLSSYRRDKTSKNMVTVVRFK